MHYVYLLQSVGDGSKYIGCSADLKKRVSDHNKGLVKSTKNKRPWKLIYYEAFISKHDAYNREKELKTVYTKKRHLLERLKGSLL